MERNKGILGIILMLSITAAGCSRHDTAPETEVRILFSSGQLACRSSDPQENKISDISLMVFDGNGSAEECLWLEEGDEGCSVKLITGKEYTFCACANFGYQVYADNIEELKDIRYHIAYPDEYSSGIPMYAWQEVPIDEGCTEVCISLKRLMSKISLRMDRRKLSEDVEMNVRSVRIGNCPRSVSVFDKSRVKGGDDCFPAGFSRSGPESEVLNKVSETGLSGYISMYMLENMQGEFGGEMTDDSDKVFGKDDYRSTLCSYIEMELEYLSGTYASGSSGLLYRFYLGEDRSSLDVERNCHYRITVAPEDDGLSENSWRVDKTGLQYTGPTYLKGYPSDYIVGDIGDRIHIWCEFLPQDAPFDVGISYMEDDKTTGIYDYTIDEDGHGAVLTLRKPGRGIVYMEAGPPIDDAALFIIEVNLPESPATL